jgi:cob(I)alamin adenosyltransferase
VTAVSTPGVPYPEHVEPPLRTHVDSRVLVNTGDGKGKSSAAFGVMVRGWARGWRVGVVQFMKAWSVARGKLASGEYDLLILDELTYLVNYGWLPVAEVVDGIAQRWPRTNVVITGRDAPPEIVELADTVTEMQVVKHAYQRGIPGRKGIEY